MEKRIFGLVFVCLTLCSAAKGQIDIECSSMDYYIKDDSISSLQMYTITICNNDSFSYTTWYDEQDVSNIEEERLIKKRIFHDHVGDNSLWVFLFSSLENGNYDSHKMFDKNTFFKQINPGEKFVYIVLAKSKNHDCILRKIAIVDSAIIKKAIGIELLPRWLFPNQQIVIVDDKLEF